MWHRLIPRISRSARQSFLAMIALAGLTFVCFRLRLNISTAGFLYLIVIVLLSLAGDYVASVVTSVVGAVCLAYFFAPPIFSIRVDDPLNIVAIIAFLTTSLVITRLVSEARTRSDKLRLSEYYLSEGQRLAHMGCWAFDATGFSYWSSELFRVHGLDPRSKPPTVEEYLTLVHPEDRAFMKQGIAITLDDHLAFDFTKRIVRPDGETRHLRCVGVPVTQGGVFQGFLGTEMDVTEQEQLTEELRRSEKELRDVIDTIPAIVWSALPDGSNAYVNRRFIEYSGMSAERSAGSGWRGAIHPDDLERQVGKWMEAVATGKPLENEVRFRRSDGQYRWHLDRGVPLRDEAGNIVKWYGVVTDIEDRKRAEEALGVLSRDLQESKAKLEEAQRITHVGYWESDLLTGRVNWSDETYRIYGMQPQERPMDIAACQEKIDPEDWRRGMEEALGARARFNAECRVIRATGEVRIAHFQGEVKRDASGQPCYMFGTVQDITDRKLAEGALQQSQMYLAEGQRLAHMGSWALNPSGFFDYWSQELFKIYGLDPQKRAPTLEQYLATVHPQDRDFMANTIKRMHAERSGCDVKKRIVRPDGELRYIRSVGIPVVEGEVLKGFLGTAMDITEQELLTEELERQQAYLAEAQKLTHTASWAWRVSDRSAVHLSGELYRIYGFDPAEGVPTLEQCSERVHPEDRSKWKGIIERAIVEKADYDHEFRILLPNGMVKWVHTVGHPIVSEAGDLEQFVGSSTDVTALKSAEQEREKLRQLEADLAHIDRVSILGEMAASLAHEIKQPIAAAIASANSCIEWLAHEPPNVDRARASAARINKYWNRAAEIIDRIRSFYKKSPPQRELVDVNGIIHEMLTLLKGEVHRYPIAMRTELAAELPKIMVDRVQLQQVFMNLMLNGIEAMEDSGGQLKVKSELQDGQLQFSVSDTGVGLPKEKIDQIFSAFFTTKPQGSGMGLAISRSIVESHGGQLWASANGGRGATFHFTLPIQLTQSSSLVA
jgi:PAS domain S-box-containing protein